MRQEGVRGEPRRECDSPRPAPSPVWRQVVYESVGGDSMT